MMLLAFLLAAITPATLPQPGTYTFSLVADSSEDIGKAINHTVQHMSFITRPVARGRLNRTNPKPSHVRVVISNDTLSVSFDDGNPVVTPMNGQEVPWHSSLTNEEYQAHTVQEGDTLSQVIVAPDGQRENAYVFAGDGTRLELRVTVTSHRLPEPLRYTLLFRRDGA
jgi:hypothetical protein